MGIGPEELAKLFVRFSQANARVGAEYGGSGLGLVLSRELAQAMGGDLSVRSVKGQGSCFTLTVPCRPTTGEERERALLLQQRSPSASVPAPVSPADTQRDAAAVDRGVERTLHILLVECMNPLERSLIETLFIWGCHVSQAFGGLCVSIAFVVVVVMVWVWL